MLDSIRYYVGLLTVATVPWALLYWYLVHPFIAFWRRLGVAITYTVLIGLGVALAAVTVHYRDLVMAKEYGTGAALWALALVAYGVSIAIELKCRKHLSWRMLAGVPEVSPQPGGGTLLSEGIYGRVRHPRYLAVSFGMLAAGLFCNYLMVWIVVAITVPALYGVAILEERELRERFGDAYLEYSRRVPRFIPRLA